MGIQGEAGGAKIKVVAGGAMDEDMLGTFYICSQVSCSLG